MLAIACLSACLPACALVLRCPFFAGHGAVSLLICSLQDAGETHEGEGYTFTIWAGYLVCNLMWPEQNLLDLGTWTRANWLGLGYSGLETKEMVQETPGDGAWSCQGLGTIYIVEVNDYFL